MQVATNGVVSFQSEFTEFLISAFPTATVPVIAPLWADFDFRSAGSVYYRVTRDSATTARARDLVIEANPEFSGFSPSFCVVVTWSQANLFSNNITVSVMCMLIYNMHYHWYQS